MKLVIDVFLLSFSRLRRFINRFFIHFFSIFTHRKHRTNRAAKASASHKTQWLAPRSTLSVDCVIEGDIRASGEIIINGIVYGNVEAKRIIIEQDGHVHGHISAEVISLRGQVNGDIHGLSVHVFASGHITGNVYNRNLSIDNGANIDGAIHHLQDPLNDIPRPQSRYWQQISEAQPVANDAYYLAENRRLAS